MAVITYLGPSGSTFSALAYYKLATLFKIPLGEGEEILAGNNEEVLPLIINHGGYGAIAMETEAEGRVDGPVNTFIKLLERYPTTADCPITVVGAIRMPLNFALMVRPGVRKSEVQILIAHPKSLGACKNLVQGLTLDGKANVVESDSNGKAAEDVATKPELALAAALGPRVAAEKYGLEVLDEACEDMPAATTFFLLGPKSHSVKPGSRAVLVFRIKHECGALVDALLPFKEEGLSLRQIHSCYTQEGQYDFFIEIEIECDRHEPDKLSRAMKKASQHMTRHILFGSFPVS